MAEGDELEPRSAIAQDQLRQITACAAKAEHRCDLAGHAPFDEMLLESKTLRKEGDCRLEVGNREGEVIDIEGHGILKVIGFFRRGNEGLGKVFR